MTLRFTERQAISHNTFLGILCIYIRYLRGISVARQDYAFWMIQSYWVIWLVGSFVVSMILGAIIFRNFEANK